MSIAASVAETGASTAIRVMIVDDSAVIRGILTNWLSGADDLQVVSAQANGRRAVDDIQKTHPDVVILDLEMPDMDGLTALPLILERKPDTAVLVASALTRRGAEISLKALNLGAADYLPKPDASGGIARAEEFKRELISKVRGLGLRARRRAARRAGISPGIVELPPPEAQGAGVPRPVAMKQRPDSKLRAFSKMPVGALAIGSSTGGPQALTKLFADIGPFIGDVPVLIVQHMPPTFTAILAEHVGRASGRPCAEAVDGESVRAGHVYVAPGGLHMQLSRPGKEIVVRLSDGPPVNFCKPAVDPMFDTVAELFGSGALAVVLTGMGSDGARGATHIADAGGSVIAQDEESSVVWGMPGATVAAGAVAEVLPLGEIGHRVTRLLSGGRR